MRSRNATLWLSLAAIVGIGAALRVIGLGFGLPAVYNPDEVAIMNRAVALGQNRLNPGNFLYPSLYFYGLFVWEGLLFVTGWMAGRFDSLAAFEQEFFTNPSIHYLAGRFFSVVCGVVTLVATWGLARRMFGAVAGLSAAALLAVAPLAVRDAHYVKHDVPVTLLIVLVHLALAIGVQARVKRWWWIAGALAGLALSTHYYAVFVLVPLVCIVSMPMEPGEPARARMNRTVAILLVAGGAFLAASPFLIVEAGTAYRDMVANREIVVDRATTTGGAFASLSFYLSWLGSDASGRIAAALALGGALLAVRTGYVRVVLTLVFPAVFILSMANTVPASRYLNPVLPFLAVLGGAVVAGVAVGDRRRQGLAVLVLAAACVDAGLMSLRADLFFRQDDTRTQALTWFETHVPEGASVLIQPYSVPLRTSRNGLVEALTHHLGSADRASVKFRRQLALEPYPAPAFRTIYLGSGGLDVDKIYVPPDAFTAGAGLEALRRMGVTYVVMKRYNVEDPAVAPLGGALKREGKLAATFSPYGTETGDPRRREVAPFLHNSDARIDRSLERPGPIIDIWTIH